MPEAIAERRGATRELYSLDVTLTLVESDDSQIKSSGSVSGRTINLSDSGICILADGFLNCSALALCKISLPFCDIKVPTLMKIRWSRKAGTEHRQQYVAGLQFLL